MDALSLSHVGLSLAAGSLTTLSPCVFPILPLVLGGTVQGNRLAPVAMGLGMALSFSMIVRHSSPETASAKLKYSPRDCLITTL